jgi:hypothetical protein
VGFYHTHFRVRVQACLFFTKGSEPSLHFCGRLVWPHSTPIGSTRTEQQPQPGRTKLIAAICNLQSPQFPKKMLAAFFMVIGLCVVSGNVASYGSCDELPHLAAWSIARGVLWLCTALIFSRALQLEAWSTAVRAQLPSRLSLSPLDVATDTTFAWKKSDRRVGKAWTAGYSFMATASLMLCFAMYSVASCGVVCTGRSAVDCRRAYFAHNLSQSSVDCVVNSIPVGCDHAVMISVALEFVAVCMPLVFLCLLILCARVDACLRKHRGLMLSESLDEGMIQPTESSHVSV